MHKRGPKSGQISGFKISSNYAARVATKAVLNFNSLETQLSLGCKLFY